MADPTRQIRVEQLSEMIATVQSRLMVDLSRELTREHLSLRRYYLLTYLSEEKHLLAMNEIGKRMGHSKTATTEHIEGLEKQGYVRRIRPKDRRKILIEVTLKGAEFIERFRALMAGKFSKLIEPLDKDEERTFLLIHEKIVERLNLSAGKKI